MDLDFSNFFGRYQGNSPSEVLAQIHAESQKVAPTTYLAWKEWNRLIWRERYGLEVPLEETPEAEAAFLDILVKVGAIYPTGTSPHLQPAIAQTEGAR